jgi:hypothetical protein
LRAQQPPTDGKRGALWRKAQARHGVVAPPSSHHSIVTDACCVGSSEFRKSIAA